jgi:hypothetical protein
MINLGAIAGLNQRPFILSGVRRKVKAAPAAKEQRLSSGKEFLKQDWHFLSMRF